MNYWELHVDVYIPNGVTALPPDIFNADNGGYLDGEAICPGTGQTISWQDRPDIPGPEGHHAVRVTIRVTNPLNGPPGGGSPSATAVAVTAYWATG